MQNNIPLKPPPKPPKQKIWCFEHDYERGSYRNGCGFCKHCGRFGMSIETGFDPLERCVICNAPTFWTFGEDTEGVHYWYCEKHADQRPRDTQPNPLDQLKADYET